MIPKAIIFCCNWFSYPGLQLSEISNEEPDLNKKIIVNMCSGRVSSELILDALKNNAWGVLIASCPEDKCEHDANYKTQRRILLLQKVLKQFGVKPQRIKLEWIDKGETGKFEKLISNFMNYLKELVPLEQLEIN